jgi:outer membrane protein assembly factor BamB
MQKSASRFHRCVRKKRQYLLPCLACLLTILGEANAQVNITTYHYDNFRTGWNNQEALLTAANVNGTQFKLLSSTPLDEQVDAQPLLLTQQTINGTPCAPCDVVYVATANNTIYAIDANSGAVLLSQNLGTPVPIASLPGSCNNNSTVLGITSTPVIDPATPAAMYVMAYTVGGAGAVYMLHKLNPTTLTDILPPVTVSPSQPLSNGLSYPFNAGVSRQRAALLLAGGNVYAAFASFCDHAKNRARGWVLGWNAATLVPVSYQNYLTNRMATSPSTFFLTSVWMSGYGPAVDETGNLFFATGNSDPTGTSFGSKLNIEESVIKLSPDLSTVIDFFTPANFATALDPVDLEFGAGGVMILPQQPGVVPFLAVAGGKDGRMFLLDRTHLGKLSLSGIDKVVGTFTIGTCFCGQSYFLGSDGVGRIVSDGGNRIIIWRVQTSPTTTLVQENVAPRFPSQNNGSFTTISSNGPSSPAAPAIIWSVERPGKGKALTARTLYAFNAATGAVLTSIPNAAVWSQLTANANIVPVVANGKVYVASDKLLNIFGLSSAASPAKAAIAFVAPAAAAPRPVAGQHRVSGEVTGVQGSYPDQSFTISTRTGTTVRAASNGPGDDTIPVVVGDNVELQGSFDSAGVFQAAVISHAKEPDAWLPDEL